MRPPAWGKLPRREETPGGTRVPGSPADRTGVPGLPAGPAAPWETAAQHGPDDLGAGRVAPEPLGPRRRVARVHGAARLDRSRSRRQQWHGPAHPIGLTTPEGPSSGPLEGPGR